MTSGATRTRSRCLVCDAPDLQLVLDYGLMPLAGGFVPADDERRHLRFPLRLARCPRCTLMQVLDVVPPAQIFHQYSYASSTTRTLIGHFARMGEELVRLGDAAGRLVVEFGCNDGVLVRPLLRAGARVVGVDPSDVARRASEGEGWNLVPTYFDEAAAAQILAREGPARIVTGNNVFAHVDDLHAMVRGVTCLLEDNGLFVFEVHYQGELLRLVQYDMVYHEHVCYHSVEGVRRLLETHHLAVVDVRPIPIHSGSMRITAAREGSRWTAAPVVKEWLARERDWDVPAFVREVERQRQDLRGLVEALRARGRRVVAYGAAGRATMLMNYAGLGPELLDYVVDMSPLRYGKVVPGVCVPIVPPAVFHATPPSHALMTAWNYEEEILGKEQDFLAGGGQFIVPLPAVRLIAARSAGARG